MFELSLTEAAKALEIDPDFGPGYVNRAFVYMYLDRIEESERAVQVATEHKVAVPELTIVRFYLSFLKGDSAAMARIAASADGKLGAEDWVSHAAALVLARGGQLQQADRLSRHAAAVAQQTGQREKAAMYQSASAVWNALFGNGARARQDAAEALARSNGRDVEYASAFALARAGDITRSKSLANDIGRRFPEDTSVQFNYLPTLRALFSLDAGKPAQALEELQTVDRYELAVPAISFFGFFGGLYPAYVRGETYLAMHRGAEAAAEFRKILAHRGIVLGDPMDAMARLQLARAFVMSGENAQARAAYEDLFQLWKNADADFPVLRQARADRTHM
jgi:hypothetical protein